jgi:signal transduction histidine kinase
LTTARNALTQEIDDQRTALLEADAVKRRLEAELYALQSRPEPAPLPDPQQAQKIAELGFELSKYQAAYQEAQTRLTGLEGELNALKDVPAVDTAPMEARLAALETDLSASRVHQAELQKTVDQLNAALSQAQRFETVGRLTSDVAQDFAQMLAVVNNALEVMAKSSDNPEQVRKLSEAALSAGKRGERLTRQLQAFNQPDYW